MLRNIAISFGLVVAALAGAAWGKGADKPDLVEKALKAMGGAEEIVFAVRGLHPSERPNVTFGVGADEPNKFMHSPDGSRLCKLNLRTKKVTVLLDDPKGGVRDPRVHYDGGKILFSYRKGGTHFYHLCEINTDGSGFRQLTFGPWDDIDPAYLPDGGIVFASSRGKRFVPCQVYQVAIIYRMDSDGGNMLCLSANNVADDRPAVLPDGRVIYTRWEYVDRHPQKFRDLWVMNPDGTGQMVFCGPVSRQYYAKCDALPIPGTNKLVSIFSPSLGHRDNAGNVMIIDPRAGPDDWSTAKLISPKIYPAWSQGLGQGRKGFRDPYPLSNDCFLVAKDKTLLILDANGETQEFYQAEKMVHDPRAIRPRPREPVIPSRIDLRKTTGQFVLADVYQGRNISGVKRGTIKKLLVIEDLPRPVGHQNNSLDGAVSLDSTLSLHRILGTVPVEPDGSASFEVPPLRGLFFVALDEKGLAVKRMQSYTMVMPGETQGCVGCHENRTETTRPHGNLMATSRAPSRIEPVPGVPELIDYPRDIQPIWNKHCVTCHSAEKPLGHVVLTGDYSEAFTQSYVSLFGFRQVSVMNSGGVASGNNPPYGFGTAASALMKKIDNHHYDVKLNKQERDMVRLWIESSAPFAGTYALCNSPESAVAGFSRSFIQPVAEMKNPVGPIVEKRCLACHVSVVASRNPRKRRRANLTKHYQNLYNLSYPEKSMVLLAPLAKDAGGYEWCKAKDGQPIAVFHDTRDPDYQTILQAVRAAKSRQEKAGRYDMPGFRPSERYVSWMKRWGILPESFDLAKDAIDLYETDEAYWRLLWHHPPTAKTASVSGQVPEGK